ncbi:MAG: hypothetical protein OXM55_06195 [Bdellovibrionales bacterium]|nr:hypothetical protein [Bdellovibrionales bacterium]
MLSFIQRSVIGFLIYFIFFSIAQGWGTSISYPPEHLNPLMSYFLDTIFENADCKCQVNDGCTRGCRLESDLEKYHPLPIRKCKGKKPVYYSYTACARHVTGAIMAVINKFLSPHCKRMYSEIFENMTYSQCIKNFDIDVQNNNVDICLYSLRFESALCMLNLDGQGSSVYNSIPTRSIRSNCKSWGMYNQLLLAINTSLYQRKMTLIPFFLKINPEKYKEFARDTNKIPEGSIIVTTLYSLHGHVEVKTNRNECGKDKSQACFCSDYCRERQKYTRPILAVFEWNPEFIRYVF